MTGKLSGGTTGLLEKIQKEIEPVIEKNGQANGPRPQGWKRPFLETPSADRALIQKAIAKTVAFPEKDESVGELILSFMGPAPNAFLERKVLLLTLFKDHVSHDRDR